MKYIPFWKEQVKHKTVLSQDGVKISYQYFESPSRQTVVLANGLGGRLYAWEPLIEKLSPKYRILTWDYRGLFESESPKHSPRLSIPDHAEDLKAILDQEKIAKACLIGWSMGVQVALEFTSLYPEQVDKLVLINGTYGQALSTGFQPFIRIPWLNRRLHEGIDFFKNRPYLIEGLSQIMTSKKVLWPLGRFYSWLRGNPKFKYVMLQYFNDIFGTDFGNYLRLFQELDAHSVFHHLREIPHRTLVIWGSLDFLTPAYQSRELVRKLKNASAKWFLLGTHFVLLEYPQAVTTCIDTFLSQD